MTSFVDTHKKGLGYNKVARRWLAENRNLFGDNFPSSPVSILRQQTCLAFNFLERLGKALAVGLRISRKRSLWSRTKRGALVFPVRLYRKSSLAHLVGQFKSRIH